MQNNWSHQIHSRDKEHKKYLYFEISGEFFIKKYSFISQQMLCHEYVGLYHSYNGLDYIQLNKKLKGLEFYGPFGKCWDFS